MAAQPAKPGAVAAAESSAQEVDSGMVDTIEAYNVALGRYVRLVRETLPAFQGYECKEPEPGKFTLAFPLGPLPFHLPSGFRVFRLLMCCLGSCTALYLCEERACMPSPITERSSGWVADGVMQSNISLDASFA